MSGRTVSRASGMMDVFKKMWPEAWGVRMEHILRNVLMAFWIHRTVMGARSQSPSSQKVNDDGSPPFRLEEHPYLTPSGTAVIRSDFRAKFGRLDTREQVTPACVNLAKRAGLDFLVLDQTRPDIEVPVVRVIVPGLRHFYRRFAPGRLYDVPVRSGSRPAAVGTRAESASPPDLEG